MISHAIHRVAFLGDHLPRQCGIATFTSNICEAVVAEFPHCDCLVGAVNDRPEGYDYPARIRFEIDEKELDSYRRAADFLNINNVEIVSVQHEFGIYGGPAGILPTSATSPNRQSGVIESASFGQRSNALRAEAVCA